ncbi:uncharacterized protein LOC131932801 [Physella acuta]|uniref:uncharacterized protein LOC131932801 n=1 Tax=Physella acuta TaxID=109671 RepID=UPI0027DCEB36|nr:uncharacterized protein LOC131932801 [Physella acuta]
MQLNTYFLLCIVTVFTIAAGESKFTWMKPDHFDEIDAQFRSVTAENCRTKNKEALVMRKDVVTQLPVYNQLLSRVWYKNRTSLIHLHNMALNRAFFYSYILQKMNTSESFSKQPGWMYMYFSATADVNANPNFINASAFYFDVNCHYPNWYTTVPFNKTIPLFGPKVYRWDDTRDQDNYLREPTRQVVQAVDYGAGQFMNYTSPKFKMNPWYPSWLPDITGGMDSLTKYTYYVGIKMSNVTGKFETKTFQHFSFFGPSSPGAHETDPRNLPVQFTPPYFDCGGANKWVVSAVSPVIDFMPRYSNFTHMRRPRVVGVSVMDTHFKELDFNACGVSDGNPGPSYLAGVHRCRKTTGCKHKPGYGFKRGGYVCHCVPGWGYPWYVEFPYQGDHVEKATVDEYKNGFTCRQVLFRQVLPVVDHMPGISIEGGDILTSSGGVVITDANKQKSKRSAERNESAAVTEKIDVYTDTSGRETNRTGHRDYVVETINGHTLDRIVALADTIRELREKNELEKTFKLKGLSTTYDLSPPRDDYVMNNKVDVNIEMEYQKDVAEHRRYRRSLVDDGSTRNYTLASEALRKHILELRERHQKRFQSGRAEAPSVRRQKRATVFDDQAFDRMMRIFRQKASVTSSNCHRLPNHQLQLPGDVTFGAKTQFETEGRTAVRLTQYLSLYLQNVMPDENYGNLRAGGILHVDQLYGEVLANVMGNFKIYTAGLFFDRYKFQNQDRSVRELFGPEAYRKQGSYFAVDRAGYSKSYVDEEWFLRAKAQYASNLSGLKLYKLRAYVRSDPNGTSSVRHEYFPLTYRAAPYEAGFWTRPYFRCDGNIDSWLIKYVSPFFGLDSLRTRLEFRGVATVEVPLNLLEINQCPMPYSVPNAFKNTARCDYFSTNCAPLAGFPFQRGSYRCNCRLGFDYWHLDGKFWIEGALLELEYEKKKAGIFSRFDLLNCRVSSAEDITPTVFLLYLTVVVSLVTT